MNYVANGALLQSTIPNFPDPVRGKVRVIDDLGDTLLFIASDRLSAFDCVMPNGIPNKGKVLTQISLFWFEMMDWIPNHLITGDFSKFPKVLQPKLHLTSHQMEADECLLAMNCLGLSSHHSSLL